MQDPSPRTGRYPQLLRILVKYNNGIIAPYAEAVGDPDIGEGSGLPSVIKLQGASRSICGVNGKVDPPVPYEKHQRAREDATSWQHLTLSMITISSSSIRFTFTSVSGMA